MRYFDELAWQKIILHPNWYVQLYPELKKLHQQWIQSPKSAKAQASKQAVIAFFEQALLDDRVALAKAGPNLDIERQAVDTIVIHHTSSKPGYTLAHLNAVQMLNIYVPYFLNPTNEQEKQLKGSALGSSHIQNGHQVFYAYHWLMRMDGTFERLLQDDQIGWHAGNWEINRRSIAICLDNDYEAQDPLPEILEKLAKFIGKKYPQVESAQIFGHCEVSKSPTICPGTNFAIWKQRLAEYL